jgi:hypothetical protein
MIVDLEQLLAALKDEVLAEPVATEHLEQEPAEVAQPLLAELEQGAPLAAQHAGRRERALRPASEDRSHSAGLKCR